MIGDLDNVLRQLLKSQVPGLKPPAPAQVTDDQVGCRPPDEDWRSHVAGLGTHRALNIYLVDLRENRKLRSNERMRDTSNGIVTEIPAPNRVDCHYLITAWSPALEEAGKTTDEHQLLHEVTAVLMNHQPLVPRKAFEPKPLPAKFPEEIADAELPSTVLPVEGFPKYGEFWATMGVNHRWKPAVYLIVTLPVLLEKQEVGAMVTTRITEYRQTGRPELPPAMWIQIGGHVLDATQANQNPPLPPVPLAGVWVVLETETGERLQTAQTNEQGRFTFGDLRAGKYRLRTQALGLGELAPEIDVPSSSGEYDLRFE